MGFGTTVVSTELRSARAHIKGILPTEVNFDLMGQENPRFSEIEPPLRMRERIAPSEMKYFVKRKLLTNPHCGTFYKKQPLIFTNRMGFSP